MMMHFLNRKLRQLFPLNLSLCAGAVFFTSFAANATPSDLFQTYAGTPVQLASKVIGPTNYQYRMCVAGAGGLLKWTYCDYSQPSQKWLPEANGLLRWQADPTKCAQASKEGTSVDLVNCPADGAAVDSAMRWHYDVQQETIRNDVSSVQCWRVDQGSAGAIRPTACNAASNDQHFVVLPQPQIFYHILYADSDLALYPDCDVSNHAQATSFQKNTCPAGYEGDAGVGALQMKSNRLSQLWYFEPTA
ncbi:MAG: ricin-type beta-trefoil lectin domain protein, partial [Enterobacteriaceae bacterium]